jgi:hypothetical protein
MNITDHGLEHPAVAEQRARERHFAEYCRSRGFRPEAASPSSRKAYEEAYGNVTAEDLAERILLNRIFNPSDDEEEPSPPPASPELRDRLRRAAEEVVGPVHREPDFMTLLNEEIARARASGEMPPEDFLGQYPFSNPFAPETPRPAGDFLSATSRISESVLRGAAETPAFSMARMSDGLSTGNDITAGIRTSAAGPVADVTSLVADLLALQRGEALGMSPDRMRESFPSAWRRQAEPAPGRDGETVARDLRETGVELDLRGCGSSEAVLAFLDERGDPRNLPTPETSLRPRFTDMLEEEGVLFPGAAAAITATPAARGAVGSLLEAVIGEFGEMAAAGAAAVRGVSATSVMLVTAFSETQELMDGEREARELQNFREAQASADRPASGATASLAASPSDPAEESTSATASPSLGQQIETDVSSVLGAAATPAGRVVSGIGTVLAGRIPYVGQVITAVNLTSNIFGLLERARNVNETEENPPVERDGGDSSQAAMPDPEDGNDRDSEGDRKPSRKIGDAGKYKELTEDTPYKDDKHVHHMPSRKYLEDNGMGTDEGFSGVMPKKQHYQTRTYGRNNLDTSTPYRTEIGRDLADYVRILKRDGLWTPRVRRSLQQGLDNFRREFPDLFKRIVGQ